MTDTALPVLVPLGTAFEDDPVQQVLARRLPWLSQGEVFSEHAFGVGDWPSQGWKLHVSATPLAGPEVLERVVPLLLDEGARFKVVNTRLQLVVLNGGGYGFSQVGKFVTVYPCDDAQAVRLALALDEVTDGLPGPRVPSDRQLRPGSLVHYRYGTFRRRVEEGVTEIADHPGLLDPAGRLTTDRTLQYYVPPSPQIIDPFEAAGAYQPRPSRRGPLAGRYMVIEVLGRSCRGGVFRALDLGTRPARHCLVKELWHDVGSDQYGRDVRTWGDNEADLLWRHDGDPFLPRCYDRFTLDENLYVVLEFIDGVPLSSELITTRGVTDGIPLDWLGTIARESAAALAHLHRLGIVLRDFKPDNLIHGPDGHYRLVDFGVAAEIGDERPPLGLGTPAYMDLDQSRGGPPCAVNDVFAWGAVMHHLACGHRSLAGQEGESGAAGGKPFARRPVRDLRPALPVELAAVIDRAVAWDPLDRFPTMVDVADALVQAGAPIVQTSPATRARAAEAPDSAVEPAAYRDDCLARARAVGDALCADAEERGPGVCWPAGRGASPSPDLYEGAAGIALFLATLANATGDGRYADTARRAAGWLMSGAWGRGRTAPGLHDGEAGVGYFLLRLAALLDEPSYRDAARLRARRLAGVPFQTLDLLYGAAGTTLFLVALAEATGDRAPLQQACTAADELVREARPVGDSVTSRYWEVPSVDLAVRARSYLGLFHGAAGIGLALAVVARATGDEHYVATALGAADLLLAQAVRQADGGWRWPRWLNGDPDDVQAQCHGAAGIGKFFLVLDRDAPDQRYRDAACAAADTISTQAHEREGSGLCHGVAGDVSYLLDCYQAYGDAQFLHQAVSTSRRLEAFRDPDNAGTYSRGDDLVSPGLMLGYAGVGAAYLRLAFPQEQPDLILS